MACLVKDSTIIILVKEVSIIKSDGASDNIVSMNSICMLSATSCGLSAASISSPIFGMGSGSHHALNVPAASIKTKINAILTISFFSNIYLVSSNNRF